MLSIGRENQPMRHIKRMFGGKAREVRGGEGSGTLVGVMAWHVRYFAGFDANLVGQ